MSVATDRLEEVGEIENGMRENGMQEWMRLLIYVHSDLFAPSHV